MALLAPIPGSRVTQRFGTPAAGVASLEPHMWAAGDRAYWQPFRGATEYAHFHPAVDLAAPTGTSILASEAGTVVFASTDGAINGVKIEVEIRPGVRYGHQHLSAFAPGIRVGSRVARGQVIALVGSTGASTGPHSHHWVSLRETGTDLKTRTILYDPASFLPGGSRANDSRIAPAAGAPPPIAPDTEADMVITLIPIDPPRLWHAKGGTLKSYKPGSPVSARAFPPGSSALTDGEVTDVDPLPAGWPAGHLLRVTNGALAGSYIAEADVDLDDPPQEADDSTDVAQLTAQVRRLRNRLNRKDAALEGADQAVKAARSI